MPLVGDYLELGNICEHLGQRDFIRGMIKKLPLVSYDSS